MSEPLDFSEYFESAVRTKLTEIGVDPDFVLFSAQTLKDGAEADRLESKYLAEIAAGPTFEDRLILIEEFILNRFDLFARLVMDRILPVTTASFKARLEVYNAFLRLNVSMHSSSAGNIFKFLSDNDRRTKLATIKLKLLSRQSHFMGVCSERLADEADFPARPTASGEPNRPDALAGSTGAFGVSKAMPAPTLLSEQDKIRIRIEAAREAWGYAKEPRPTTGHPLSSSSSDLQVTHEIEAAKVDNVEVKRKAEQSPKLIFDSEFKRATMACFIQKPNASALEACRFADDQGVKRKQGTSYEAIYLKQGRPKQSLEATIAKVRGAMRKAGMLP